MIDIFQFAERIKPMVDSKTPFMAYWHPRGYAILRTGPVERTETVYLVDSPRIKKPMKVSKGGISEFRRIMRKLEQQNPYARTVEFDCPA